VYFLLDDLARLPAGKDAVGTVLVWVLFLLGSLKRTLWLMAGNLALVLYVRLGMPHSASMEIAAGWVLSFTGRTLLTQSAFQSSCVLCVVRIWPVLLALVTVRLREEPVIGLSGLPEEAARVAMPQAIIRKML
jgi:hypothetical protein